jgi:hypothetical protein
MRTPSIRRVRQRRRNSGCLNFQRSTPPPPHTLPRAAPTHDHIFLCSSTYWFYTTLLGIRQPSGFGGAVGFAEVCW